VNDDKLKGAHLESELEKKSRAFINTVASVDIDTLRPVFNNKEGRIYFFRWEDLSKILDDSTKPFIQVAFSSIDGNLVSYTNTLPLAMTNSEIALRKIGMLPTIAKATFNEVYANGSVTAPAHWAWVTGTNYKKTVANSGYCYVAGWCSPKNYFWGYTDATTNPNTPKMTGKWIPNISTQATRAWAWIPCNNATAWAYYQAHTSSGLIQNYIDQEIYCDQWTLVFGYFDSYRDILLHNNADIANYKVAWDETWLCTSDICP
jgi:hypothetical protein